MGNSDSKPADTHAPRERHEARDRPRDAGRERERNRDRELEKDREEKKKKEEPAVTASPKTVTQPKPIAIPTGSAPQSDRAEASPAQPIPVPTSATSEDVPAEALPPSDFDFNRAPRLPLPIGEEAYAPGSPIFSPQRVADDVDPQPLDPGSPAPSGGNVPRRTSLLSSTTADDEEDEDFEERTDELQHGTVVEGTVKTVPTLVEWLEGGEKVYVTGTFANWDRKIRLRENGPSRRPNALSAIIQFPPGTHHVRFIIDGDMRTSKNLPVAVDFAGFLVNYIEISSAPPSATGSTTAVATAGQASLPPAPTAPLDIPAARVQTPVQTQQQQRDLPHRDVPQHRASLNVQERQHAPDVAVPPPKPLLERSQAEQKAPQTPSTAPATAPATKDRRPEYKPAQLVKGPTKKYHNEIPRFLLDLDSAEDSPRLARANAVSATLPAPPSLPLFLAKSILNKETPMKDDASVLVLPNHTVLNHLATSSIKDKVLATSATTRYKQKMLTTIMFKPTSDKHEVA